VERPGEHLVMAHCYPSARYGQAQLSVDGQALPTPFTGSKDAPQAVELGRVNLTAGEHTFHVEMLAASGSGDWWIGVQGFTFVQPSDLERMSKAQPEPFIESVESSSSPRPTAVRVRLRDGTVHEIQFGEGFALRRTRDSKAVGGCQMALNAWRGKLTAVDYGRSVVTTDAPLPTDGSLNSQIIYFNNPTYTRNTPYRIASVKRVGDLSAVPGTAQAGKTEISLGETSLFLGKGRVDGAPPDRRTLVSLIPHDHARALQQLSPNGFFTGKLLRTADGKKTTRVLDLAYGQPLVVKVDDSRLFQHGDEFFYCDVQAGDDFAIHSVTSRL
jgi:hypothetical protein